MDEPRTPVKISILQRLRQEWVNSNYRASQEARIAGAIGDSQMKTRGIELMRSAMTAVDEIDKSLAELAEQEA